MNETTSKTLYTYWNSLRGERLAPKRFEIEPSCIADILPDAFILERVDAITSRFRLAGTRICEAFGTEFRGVNLFDLFPEHDRITLRRQMAAIAQQGAAGVFQIRSENEIGRPVHFELLVLPLTHTRDVVDRFLGSISFINHPAWLGTQPLTVHTLVASELIWPNGRAQTVVKHTPRQAPFSPYIREARIVRADRRQFRVYDGGLSQTDKD